MMCAPRDGLADAAHPDDAQRLARDMGAQHLRRVPAFPKPGTHQPLAFRGDFSRPSRAVDYRLYLPALIAAGTRSSDTLLYRDHAHLTRMVFTLVATPAALLAIGTGTLLFVRESVFDPWLILKLSAVAGMVLCHALCGVLILRIERTPERAIGRECLGIGVLTPAEADESLGIMAGALSRLKL